MPSENGPIRGEANREMAARVRRQARTLSGRIHLSAAGVAMVSGRPDPLRLLEGLERWCDLAASVGPGPIELGFDRGNVMPVGASGLAVRGRAVQAWRRMVEGELVVRGIRPARRTVLKQYLAEIAGLAERVVVLHQLLAPSGFVPAQSPYALTASDEAAYLALLDEATAGRVLPPEVERLTRLAMWLGGATVARRLLATLGGELLDPERFAERAALLRVQGVIERLLRDRGTFKRPSKRRARIESQVYPRRMDRREEGELRNAVATLPERLRGPDGIRLPARMRDVNLGLLAERCEELLGGYPHALDAKKVARLAALFTCDGATTPLPWSWMQDGEAGAVQSLVEDCLGKPGYERLLGCLHELPGLRHYEFEPAQRLLAAGSTPENVRWWHQTLAARHPDGDAGNYDLDMVRTVVGWFDTHGAGLTADEIRDFWDALADVDSRAGFAGLALFLAWLPIAAVTPAVVAEVRGLMRLISVPGSLRGPLRDRFRIWAEPPKGVRLPAECPPGLPGEVTDILRRLAYFQRMAGEPPRLPKSIAKPLTAAARAMRELEHLRAERAAGRLHGSQCARLDALEAGGDRTGADSGAGKLLRQAREVCALTALHAARQLFRRQIREWWAARFADPPRLDALPWEHVCEMARWVDRLSADDRGRADRLFEANRNHGPAYREHLAENRDWLDRARHRGIDLAEWLSPPAEIVTVGGKAVVISAAATPEDVLLMGTRFRTCLSLRDGCNRDAVLANAAEANKAVLYARTPQGTHVARKLVGITADWRVVGFRSYSVGDHDEGLGRAITDYCGRWAARAGLRLTDRGRPEPLGGGFWYDDGADAWSDEARAAWAAASNLPAELTETDGTRSGRAWRDVPDADGPGPLEEYLAASRGTSEWAPAAGRYLERFPREAAKRIGWLRGLATTDDSRELAHWLAARGLYLGAAAPRHWIAEGLLDFTSRTFLVLVAEASGDLTGAMNEVRGIEPTREGWRYFHEYLPPLALARAGAGALVDLFLRLRRSWDATSNDSNDARAAHGHWAAILATARAADAGFAPLARGLRSGDTEFVRVFVELCRRDPFPDGLRVLRRTLKQEPGHPATAAIREVLSAPHPVPLSLWERAQLDALTDFDTRRQFPAHVRAGYLSALWDGIAGAFQGPFDCLPALFRWLETFHVAIQETLWDGPVLERVARSLQHDETRFFLLGALAAGHSPRYDAVMVFLRTLSVGYPAAFARFQDDANRWLPAGFTLPPKA